MLHLNDGELRLLLDEPLRGTTSILHRIIRRRSPQINRHLDGCEQCRNRQAVIAADTTRVERALSVPATTVDAQAALALIHRRLSTTASGVPGTAHRRQPVLDHPVLVRRRSVRSAGAVAAVAALVGVLSLTPAGSLAQSFLTIFQPQSVVAVPVTTADLRQLADLRRYGTVQAPARLPTHTATSPAAAATLAGMPVLVPSTGAPAVVARYTVIPSASASFTFSATKAQAAAQATGKPIPAMPARINGSTLDLTLGTTVVATYGAAGTIPQLVVGETRAPIIRSTGVSLPTLERYVLHLPGVSPQLAREIRQINNPTSVLPIPVPVNLAQAHTVQVQGVSGLEVGDSTGLGSGVVWEKDGVIYGVAGPLTDTQALAIADGLH